MTEPNIALLEEHLAYLEAHPEQHDQSLYVNECGTAFCLAGLCALEFAERRGWFHNAQLSYHGGSFVEMVGTRQEIHEAEDIARDQYRITGEDSVALFHEHNSLEDMKLMVKNLANGDYILDGLEDHPEYDNDEWH